MADEAQGEIAALAARVAELERQVGLLTRATTAFGTPTLRTVAPVKPDTVFVAPPPIPDDPGMPNISPRPPAPTAPMQETEARAVARDQSLENRLGSQVFNMIGIVAILVGTSWFLKLAIERGWVGPLARVLIGLAAGAGLVVWSERFRRRGFAAFSYSLKAVGSAILYLSLWAAFQLYHLLPASVALTAMVLVTAWNGFMAWSQDAELLAAYGLVGGFATPLLLSTGGNHETFLFTYIAAIDVALVCLLRSKPWQKLALPAFAATAGYFVGWYVQWFHSGGRGAMDAESWETAGFAVAFWAVFAVVPVRGFRRGVDDAREVIVPVLLPLAGAAWIGCALYSVLQDSGLHSLLPWQMVALAAVYLALTRIQAAAVSSAMHLAAAVVFLTIAIPLKASGHTLTTAWLIEGLVLYWAATQVRAASGAPAKVLGWLSAAGFGLGMLSLWFHYRWMAADVAFLNRDLGAALVGVGALSGVAWLAAREGQRNYGALMTALIGVDVVAVLLTSREVATGYVWRSVHAAFANAEFWTAMVGLAVLAGVAWWAWRLAPAEAGSTLASRGWGTHEPGQDLRVLAGGTLIAFNLLTILSVEREIGALWTRAAADLQRSLAISGFLMLYGAVLLAVGFWRRSAFVRWQALVLLLFTIGKVFLYDISGLSQGYRVASFLALGALLMAVSFAYQKDWLGLKAGSDEEAAQ